MPFTSSSGGRVTRVWTPEHRSWTGDGARTEGVRSTGPDGLWSMFGGFLWRLPVSELPESSRPVLDLSEDCRKRCLSVCSGGTRRGCTSARARNIFVVGRDRPPLRYLRKQVPLPPFYRGGGPSRDLSRGVSVWSWGLGTPAICVSLLESRVSPVPVSWDEYSVCRSGPRVSGSV